jgi:beta-glucosidase
MNRRESLKLLSLAGMSGFIPYPLQALSINSLKKKDFGNDFIWGVATAAYQIEGAWNIGGKGKSIWDTFTEKKRNIKDRSNGQTACDFYHLYEQDIKLIKQLGFDVFRFSIAWSRILPNGTGHVNQQGIDFYNRVIDCCLENGITPWITLYHWDLPQALEDKGGWTNRQIVDWFREYVTLCCHSFGDRVKNWLVFNEPMGFTSLGYMTGYHAPGRKGLSNFFPAVHHTCLCQALGGKLIKVLVPNVFVGTTFSCAPVEPKNEKEIHREAAERIDVLLNRLFIEPLMGMGYPWHDLTLLKRIEKYMQAGDETLLKFDFDFIGLQNYFRVIGKHSLYPPLVWANEVKPQKRDVPLTAMNWEVHPEGLYKVLKRFAQYPVKQLFVTENGAAFDDILQNGRVHDTERVNYFKDYLAQLLRAKNEGVNVGGYLAWTFMDNFEWAEGFSARFGMVYNDFETQKRIVKDSGLWFKSFLG